MAKKPVKKRATGGYVNDRMGASLPPPSYSTVSWKGLTSSDAANVARNSEAAATQSRVSSGSESGSGRYTKGSSSSAAAAAAATPPTPTKVMKRTYTPPPKGYDAGKSGEWSYYKTEMVDSPNTPVVKKKAGGTMRGCGCAKRGTKGGRMV